jgi:hypothetical protein
MLLLGDVLGGDDDGDRDRAALAATADAGAGALTLTLTRAELRRAVCAHADGVLRRPVCAAAQLCARGDERAAWPVLVDASAGGVVAVLAVAAVVQAGATCVPLVCDARWGDAVDEDATASPQHRSVVDAVRALHARVLVLPDEDAAGAPRSRAHDDAAAMLRACPSLECVVCMVAACTRAHAPCECVALWRDQRRADAAADGGTCARSAYAYAVLTSGTASGAPSLVRVPADAAAAHVRDCAEAFGWRAGDRVALASPLSYASRGAASIAHARSHSRHRRAASTRRSCACTARGRRARAAWYAVRVRAPRVHVAPTPTTACAQALPARVVRAAGRELSRQLASARVSALHCTPALLRHWRATAGAHAVPPCVRCIAVGGEPPPPLDELCEMLVRACSGAAHGMRLTPRSRAERRCGRRASGRRERVRPDRGVGGACCAVPCHAVPRMRPALADNCDGAARSGAARSIWARGEPRGRTTRRRAALPTMSACGPSPSVARSAARRT